MDKFTMHPNTIHGCKFIQRWLGFVLVSAALSGCSFGGCEKYASDYSCSYVENDAEYEVWYWRNVEDDVQSDDKLIGKAVGIQMCEDNARAYAASINEAFDYRAYVCVLMDDGNRMEKHRLIG